LSYFLQSLVKARQQDSSIHDTLTDAQLKESKHVIIVGYGLNGRNLARVLRAVEVPYIALEMNAETVSQAKAKGERIYFGDATRREVLSHVCIDQASVIVLAISDPTATRHTVYQAREMNPDIHIIVRTRYLAEMNDLIALGADEVIPEEFETSIEIFSRVLHKYGVSRLLVQKQIDIIREEGYEMLRSPSAIPLQMKELSEAMGAFSSETLLVEEGNFVIGKTIGELNLRQKTNSTITAVIRDSSTEIAPGAKFRIKEGDILVILGKEEDLQKALQLIQNG
jgi:CPA2 family monovalent cation:H+ antiporter-2